MDDMTQPLDDEESIEECYARLTLGKDNGGGLDCDDALEHADTSKDGTISGLRWAEAQGKKKIITLPAHCPPPYYFVFPPFPFSLSYSHDF